MFRYRNDAGRQGHLIKVTSLFFFLYIKGDEIAAASAQKLVESERLRCAEPLIMGNDDRRGGSHVRRIYTPTSVCAGVNLSRINSLIASEPGEAPGGSLYYTLLLCMYVLYTAVCAHNISSSQLVLPGRKGVCWRERERGKGTRRAYTLREATCLRSFSRLVYSCTHRRLIILFNLRLSLSLSDHYMCTCLMASAIMLILG